MTIEESIQEAAGHAEAGRLEQAEWAYYRALNEDPKNGRALNELGIILARRGRMADAKAVLQRALANAPRPEVHVNLANVLRQMGQAEGAVEHYRVALALEPGMGSAYVGCAAALRDLGNLVEAEEACKSALAIRKDHPEALNNLGSILWQVGRIDEAVAACQAALAVREDYSSALVNLGIALSGQGKWEESVESLRRAVAIAPKSALAHWNLGLMLLRLGRFGEGLREYEWREKINTHRKPNRVFAEPRWDGSELRGDTILLYSDQGYGDTIQFVRYAQEVARRGGRVVMECQAGLRRLVTGMKDVAEVVAAEEKLPAFVRQCPLASLPLLCGTTVQTIPGATPYMKADEAGTRRWRERLASAGNGRKIGLCWTRDPTQSSDREKAIPAGMLAALAKIEGATFVSLQVGGDRQMLGVPLTDWTAELIDFADTAALICALDLVISIDTAVAHLAGALGREVWTLLPFPADWRWLLGRSDSPWYPTMRLFQQKRVGDWEAPIREVVEALRR